MANNFSRPKQGQIGWISLDPTSGHEQRGRRPVLVISNDDFNELCGGMVKVLPITSRMRKFPLHLEVPDGLPIHGMVKLEQERTLDIDARNWEEVCSVPEYFLDKILKVVLATY